jgi:hypothetical protein
MRIVLVDEEGAPDGASATLLRIINSAVNFEGQDGEFLQLLTAMRTHIACLKGTAQSVADCRDTCVSRANTDARVFVHYRWFPAISSKVRASHIHAKELHPSRQYQCLEGGTRWSANTATGIR